MGKARPNMIWLAQVGFRFKRKKEERRNGIQGSTDSLLLHQHLPCVSYIVVDFMFNFGVDHGFWPPTVWAGHSWCCAKQSTNQRSLPIHSAAIRPKVYAPEVG